MFTNTATSYRKTMDSQNDTAISRAALAAGESDANGHEAGESNAETPAAAEVDR